MSGEQLKGQVHVSQHLKSALRLHDGSWSLLLSCGHTKIVNADPHAFTIRAGTQPYPDHSCTECSMLASRLLAQQMPVILTDPMP